MSTPLLELPTIRVLARDDLPLLRDHLVRLDPDSRRDRFNGAVDGDFVSRYAAGCGAPGVTVLGYFRDGEIHAAAEIHEPSRTPDQMPEVAFSVERHLRRQGVGSALFAAMLIEAKTAGYERLRITTGAQNCAMRALAQKFGTKLIFRHGELSGTIDLAHISMPDTVAKSSKQDFMDVLLGFNRAVWAPVLKMYGMQPPKPTGASPAKPRPSKGDASASST